MVAANKWDWADRAADVLGSLLGLESDTENPVPANTDETEGETSGDLDLKFLTDSTYTSIDDVKSRDSITSNKDIGTTPFYYDSDGEDTGKTYITTTKQLHTEPVASIIPPSTPATTIAVPQSTTTNKSTEKFPTPTTTAITSITAEKPTPILPTQTIAAATKASTVASTMKPTLAVTLTSHLSLKVKKRKIKKIIQKKLSLELSPSTTPDPATIPVIIPNGFGENWTGLPVGEKGKKPEVEELDKSWIDYIKELSLTQHVLLVIMVVSFACLTWIIYVRCGMFDRHALPDNSLVTPVKEDLNKSSKHAVSPV